MREIIKVWRAKSDLGWLNRVAIIVGNEVSLVGVSGVFWTIRDWFAFIDI